MERTTRRNVLGAIAAASTMMATLPASAGAAQPVSTDTLDPTGAFARAWLAQWTSLGGSFLQQRDGGWIYGWPEYDLSPVHRQDRALMEEAGLEAKAIEQRLIEWHQPNYNGRIRATREILECAPGLIDAVKTVLVEEPSRGFPIPVKMEG